ncbi:MAG TPA: TIGR03619 family F420-dependent LLM class oxidoreductase [Ktedonobacterales bacterium]|nr:TIGR03619 family F420-dependent LLM class oxidoreductase [Ktedonobacterales bacterium]
MRYGVFLPPFGPCADLATLTALAADAEEAGWDGFFLWDDITTGDPMPVADPWIAMAAIAVRTQTLRLGATVTPLPRRRPWKVAREAITLDHLSQGRLIVGVGLGISHSEFDDLGEETDLKVRGAMLDEGLDILAGLWSGEPFQYEGTHYHIRKAQFLPRPVQTPRIPIWVGGSWPLKAPFRRAARWDGVFPLGRDLSLTEQLAPEDVQGILSIVHEQRAQAGIEDKPIDVVHCGLSSGTDQQADRALARTYADVGVTWWLEHLVPERWGSWSEWPLEAMRERVRQGPPRAAR